MSEQYPHTALHEPLPITEVDFRARPGSSLVDVIEKSDERHEFAVDAHKFGSIAVASEIEVELLTGQPASRKDFDQSVNRFGLRKKVGIDMVEGKLVRQVDQQAHETHSIITNLNDELARVATGTPESAQSFIAAKVAELRNGRLGTDAAGNFDMVMNGAAVSPFILAQKGEMAAAKRVAPEDYKWSSWFTEASDEQLVNFAQWYSQETKKVATPEARKHHSEELRKDYLGKVDAAVADGWLSSDFAKRAKNRVNRTSVRYFSAFGQYSTEFGAGNQKSRFGNLIAMPSVDSPATIVHEFGHSASELDRQGLRNRYDSATQVAKDLFFEVLNEGYDEHLTIALMEGQPEVINPAERPDHGHAIAAGHSDGYEKYREIFGLVVEGKQGRLTKDDIKQLTDSMENFNDFEAFVTARWNGRQVLDGIMAAIEENTHSLDGRPDPVGGAEAFLRQAKTA